MPRGNASDAARGRDPWAFRGLARAAAKGARWPHGAAPRRRWRGWAGALLGLLLLGSLPWRRLTLSPSVPRGLYRLHRVPAAVTYGQLGLVDVPEALRPWWPRRTPLLKPVVGLHGDVLTVHEGHFYVNARDSAP